MSLYRKYRPHNFDNLVGQDNIKAILTNAFKSGNVTHAYLFTGPRGTGKTSTARLIAKALNCQNLKDGFEPCDKCELCNDINEGRLIDLIEIDAASNRGIDEVRDLKEKINFAPSRSKYKIYIVDEVHMMTKEAFNALLKTLEEPPEHVYFILATTEVHKIPETIISRCQRFDFRRIEMKALMTRLSYIAQKEGIEAEDGAIELISKFSNGGLRDAIGLLEQLSAEKKLSLEQVENVLGVSNTTLMGKLFESLMNKNANEGLKIIHELHDQGSDLKQFTHEFVDTLRQKMIESVMQGNVELTGNLIGMIEIFQEAQYKLEASIPQLSLEIAIIKVCGLVKKEENIVGEKKAAEVKKETLESKKEVIVKKKEEKIEPKKAESKAEIESEKISTTEVVLEATLSAVKEKWPRVLERLKTPSLRMSIKNATPVTLEGAALTLEFGTKFHKEKVDEHDNRVELEQIIEEVLGSPVKVTTAVKSLELKSVVNEDKEKTLDEALEIFGGEVV